MHREILIFPTRGRQTICITDDIQEVASKAKTKTGLCHLFLRHTSASLILCENTDPNVRADLETFTRSLVVDGDPRYLHDMEGPDDMPAHIRTVYTHSNLTIPYEDGKLLLARFSHTISSKGGQNGVSDLFSIGRRHCQNDKESPIEGKDDTTDCADLPRECEKCGLGTWQGVYLWEHRTSGHHRNVIVTLMGP